MIPILTPAEMGSVDAAAPEPLEVLVGRAGAAVARAALDLLGGAYGRRVVVIAGPGNNGADGRVAADGLSRRGVRVEVLEAGDLPAVLPACDLVVDAAYGTGFRGAWRAPDADGAPVLAVDIPSGVDGLTGVVGEGTEPLQAWRTVTFAALKPGLLLDRGAELAGEVTVADIGLDVSGATAHLVTDADVAAWLPERPPSSHKWRSAVWVVAGSPGMAGAAALAAGGAQRTGAGYVRVSSPGGLPGEGIPTEAVGTELPAEGWAAEALADQDRFGALVAGPGLGTADATATEVRRLLAGSTVPVVADGDALTALGTDVARYVTARTVLTPHDGELVRLTGAAPSADRLGEARSLAAAAGCTVLLKGSTTVVAAPDGRVLVTTTGDARLATAGTGDVLAGAIAALLASGLDPLRAAAAAAHLHGRAGTLGWRRGLVAGDLVDLLPAAIDRLDRLDPPAPAGGSPR
ncbi:MAG TPA: NAD(P)H-hydrate dehydratase [Acidimicrobiales bacterium]|nr:NAD(P)H-hydrate dehydratase [Acidimicrobiales bacterium]